MRLKVSERHEYRRVHLALIGIRGYLRRKVARTSDRLDQASLVYL
jgi:hypothetical protein